MRLYPAEHPVVAESLGLLAGLLDSYLSESGLLLLEVQEDQLLQDGEPVYSHAPRPDNMAFLMFRDGIRSLTFHAGLETREVEAFVRCLAQANDLTESDHDLVTRLWEQDFSHIDYYVADPFLGGEVLREGTIDVLRETVLRRLDQVRSGEGLAGGPRTGRLQAIRPTPVDLSRLDSGESATGEGPADGSQRTVDEAADLVRDFLVVLLEIVSTDSRNYDSASYGEEAPLTRALVRVVETYLEGPDWAGLELVLEQLQQLEAQGRCPAGYLGLVMSQAVTAERVGRLLAREGQEAPPDTERAKRFLRAVSPWTTSALLEALVVAEDRSARKHLLDLLESGPGLALEQLASLLEDSRWYVVRNAVQLAAGMRDSAVVPHLERLRRHPDARVRREVVRALGGFGAGPVVLRALAATLDDEDSSVRTLAARALGWLGGREQETSLLAQVEARDFPLRPQEEVEALLGAYAAIARERALPLLDKMWRRRLLGARPLAVRLAALKALAAVPSAAAQAVLREAAKSGESQIRKAAMQALQDGQSGRSGGGGGRP